MIKKISKESPNFPRCQPAFVQSSSFPIILQLWKKIACKLALVFVPKKTTEGR